jgi:hypothetical protein
MENPHAVIAREERPKQSLSQNVSSHAVIARSAATKQSLSQTFIVRDCFVALAMTAKGDAMTAKGDAMTVKGEGRWFRPFISFFIFHHFAFYLKIIMSYDLENKYE